MRVLRVTFLAVSATLLAMLREIFDENAYRRFLLSKRMQSSADVYRSFRQRNELLKARRPKCC